VTQYSERELVLPTLAFLDQAPAGLTTSDLIALLTEAMEPDGHDAEIINGRQDTYFSQKVRNLISHRTLVDLGYTTYTPALQLQVITGAGRQYLLDEQVAQGNFDLGRMERAEASGTQFGAYRRADENPTTGQRAPVTVDPDAVDRATGSHARLQNSLATWVTGRGLKPLRWTGGVAEFDLAWFDGEALFVAEVKSLTQTNETGQLRLGLGQVLHYQFLLRRTTPDVRAVLVVEYEPSLEWQDLCASLGVALGWAETFDRLATPTQ
jgi:hypothetical protein